MIFQRNSLNQKFVKDLKKQTLFILLEKSAYELLELILKKNIEGKEINMAAYPEYWVGWVLAYTKVVYM